MKATSLSINLHCGCNAKCPFCISRLTGKGRGDVLSTPAFLRAAKKAVRFAEFHRVGTVLITGKGEPTTKLNEAVFPMLSMVEEAGIPIVELQTNGALLKKDSIESLAQAGLTTLALSICSMDPMRSAEIMGLPGNYDYRQVIRTALGAGMMVRLSLNAIASEIPYNLWDLCGAAKDYGAHQLTIRKIGVPERAEKDAPEISEWIKENAHRGMDAVMAGIEDNGTPVRKLEYGAMVYDVEGLSVVVTGCSTEGHNPEEIRSLILQPDGHLYTSWSYQGSILF